MLFYDFDEPHVVFSHFHFQASAVLEPGLEVVILRSESDDPSLQLLDPALQIFCALTLPDLSLQPQNAALDLPGAFRVPGDVWIGAFRVPEDVWWMLPSSMVSSRLVRLASSSSSRVLYESESARTIQICMIDSLSIVPPSSSTSVTLRLAFGTTGFGTLLHLNFVAVHSSHAFRLLIRVQTRPFAAHR